MASRSSPVPSRRASLGLDRGREERPRVRSDARPGYLKRHRDTDRTAGLHIHQGVKNCFLAVEISCQPPAPIPVQKRIETKMDLTLQVRCDYRRCEGQVIAVLVPGALAPAAADRRNPAAFPGARIVEPGRVHVRTGGEQRGVERDLFRRRRPVIHQPRGHLEIRCLSGTGRRSLLRSELQQAQQPRVLGPEPRQLSIDGHRSIRHPDTLPRHDHRVTQVPALARSQTGLI